LNQAISRDFDVELGPDQRKRLALSTRQHGGMFISDYA